MRLKHFERLSSQGRLLWSGLVSAPQSVWLECCNQQQTSLTSLRAYPRDGRLDSSLPTFTRQTTPYRRCADDTHTKAKRPPTVYLIHFNQAYRHARHYLGFTEHLDKRITDHLCGMGARLLEVVTQAGIEWRLACAWPGDRELERRLKNRKEAPKLCPICAGAKALNRAKEEAR